MNSQASGVDRLSLVLGGREASVVDADRSRTIPSDCAQRSTLITELREQEDGEGDVDLPLSWQDVEAWLACSGSPYSAEQDDATLLRGLKTADFLRDEETMADVVDSLSLVLQQAMQENPGVGSSESRVRACKIIQAVPQHTVLAILSAIANRLLDSMQLQSSSAGFKRCSVSEKYTFQRKALMKAHASRLLQLLPDTFHPAVVQTFCLSPSDARCCELQLSVSCKALGDACNEAAGPPCPCITPALQFLAATAHLAGGRAAPHADRASDGDDIAVRADSASDAHRSMHVSGSRGPLQLLPAAGDPDFVTDHDFAWQLPGGALTSLRLEIDTASAPPDVPPLWWTALGLLRALRAVSLTIGVQRETVATDIRAPELAAALRSLPDLQSLELEREPAPSVCDDDVDGEEAPEWEDVWISDRDYHPDDGAMLELLHAISCMTQLESLSLTAILKFPPVATAAAVVGPCGTAAIDVISQLSRLSRLTRLAFSTAVKSVESGWAAAFAGAVKRLPLLRELEMELVATIGDNGVLRSAEPEELLALLVTGPGLPALHRLACNATEENGHLDPLPEFSAARLHEAMREQNAALLTRLTALRLQYVFELWQAEALASMIGDMPALQSLDLQGNHFKDHGLLCLARVVPRLPGLTHLDVRDCIAAQAGVLALLEALLQPGAAGRERLRCLDISMNSMRPRSAQRLADALRQFRGLTYLDMSFLELGREGLRVAVGALETLPELRYLDASGSGVGDVRSLFTGCTADMPDMPNDTDDGEDDDVDDSHVHWESGDEDDSDLESGDDDDDDEDEDD